MRLEKLFHACLALLFLAVVCAIFVSTAKASDATVELRLAWDAPTTGGPVADYDLVCTGDIPASAVTLQTEYTAGPATFTGGTISGDCRIAARGPGGTGPAVEVAWSYSIDIVPPAPGPVENFRITLDCTIAEGTVTCEQV